VGSVAGVRVTEETFPACVGKEADCGFHEFTVVTCFEAPGSGLLRKSEKNLE
jgi:hypothetical protein